MDDTEMEEENIVPVEVEDALREEEENLNFLRRNVQIRHILTIMGFLSFAILNMLKVNMSVGIVCMVNFYSIPNESINKSCLQKLNDSHASIRRPLEDGPFKIQPDMQGHILAGYFYGLLATQYLGVFLAERLRAKYLLLGGTLISSICTVIIPQVVDDKGIYVVLVQILKGAAQGIIIPAFSVLMGKWIPLSERFYSMCLIGSGIPFGGFLGTYVAGVICQNKDTLGWAYIFYIFGGIGLIWCIFWLIMIFESPLTHPYITHNEMIRILKSQVILPQANIAVPWKEILTSLPVWAFIIVGFASFWALSVYITLIPTFMSTVLFFKIEMAGVWASLPYILEMIFFLFSCVLNDRLKKIGRIPENKIHKWSIVFGLAGFSVLMLAMPFTFAGCNRIFPVFCLVLALGFCGIIFASTSYIPLELSPRFSGEISAIMNTFGAITGIIAPTMMGYLTIDRTSMNEWQILFFLSGALGIIALVFYLIFGSSSVQQWDDPAYRGVAGSQEQELVVEIDTTPEGKIDINLLQEPGKETKEQ